MILVDGKFDTRRDSISATVEQLRLIADRLESGEHYAMLFHIANYQVLVNWDNSKFQVIA